MTLQGKTALVTGGGRDIGRSVSIALARAGVRVAINYNSGREAAEETLKAIKDAGGDAFLIQADVTDSNAVKAMLDEVGIAFSGRSEEHTSELQSLMRISYAVFCLTKKT